MVIGGREFEGRNILLEPAEGAFICVTSSDQYRSGIEVGEVAPTHRRAGKLPAHQAQTNKSESNFSGHLFSGGTICLRGEEQTRARLQKGLRYHNRPRRRRSRLWDLQESGKMERLQEVRLRPFGKQPRTTTTTRTMR